MSRRTFRIHFANFVLLAAFCAVGVTGLGFTFAGSVGPSRAGVIRERFTGGTLPADLGAQEAQSRPRTGEPLTGERTAAKASTPGFASESPECKMGDCARSHPTLVARSRGASHVPAGGANQPYLRESPLPGSYLRTLAADAARRCRVPVDLFLALVARESSFNPAAVSKSGARGLAQLLPRYHSHPLLDIDDPRTNLSIGCAYLRRLIDLREGNVRLALLDYNAGQNRKATNQATHDYAADVMGSAQ